MYSNFLLTATEPEKITSSQEAHLATLDAFKRKVPIKRLGTPDEVAKVALFLASEDSSSILGAEIYAGWWCCTTVTLISAERGGVIVRVICDTK